jgi:hypothetical protein
MANGEKNNATALKVTVSILGSIVLLIGGLLYAGHNDRIKSVETVTGELVVSVSELKEFSKSSRDDRAQLRTEVSALRRELNEKMDYIIRLQLEAKKK